MIKVNPLKKLSMLKNKKMSNTLNKLMLLFFTVFVFIPEGYSQAIADPGIGILMSPSSVTQGSTGILRASVGNYGNDTIVENSLRVTISVGSNAEIIGIAQGSDPRWTQLGSLTPGSGNTIKLTNTNGRLDSFDVKDVLLTVRGNMASESEVILGNIVYITAQNPLLCGGCASPPLNASQGNDVNSNDNGQTSLAISVSVIVAVVDTTATINGNTGGITSALTANDSLNGVLVTIGAVSGNVTLEGLTVPAGLTLNTDGTVTVAANTPAANYSLEYKICEIDNPANCDTVTSTIVVSAADIIAVDTTASPVNGQEGGINVVNVLTNDTLNGLVVSLGDIHLTTVSSSNANLTLDTLGFINLAENTPAGTYTLTYQICEKLNIANCSQAVVTVEVFRLPDFTPTIDIDALGFPFGGPPKDFVVNLSEINGASSDGAIVVQIIKGNAFRITYEATTTTSNVNNTVSVNNNEWDITETSSLITMTLKPGVLIETNTFSAIGFTIERIAGTPSQTTQPITVTIVNGSGLDSENYNNTYTTVMTAQ
jgi:hypothetical protein